MKCFNIINIFLLSMVVLYNISDSKDNINLLNNHSDAIKTSIYMKVKNVHHIKDDTNNIYFKTNDIKECLQFKMNDNTNELIDFTQDYTNNQCIEQLVEYDDNINSYIMVNNEIYNVIFKNINFTEEDIVFSYELLDNSVIKHVRSQTYEIIWNLKPRESVNNYFKFIKNYDPLVTYFKTFFEYAYEIADTFV